MALSLRLRSGDVEPAPELPFDAPRVVVGRAPGCDLQLPDPSVSLRHASLRQRGSEYVVVDEGSENGTYAGGTRLPRHAPHKVENGDLLRFGRVWVEVRLGPAEQPTEVQASRELARRLVDAALAADAKPYGMTVSEPAGERRLRLDEPRRAYLVGCKKGADLKLASGEAPSRALELRRQGDQLWVTLQPGAEAKLAERELVEGERTAWPKGVSLELGAVRLELQDPTAAILERLEKGPTERLADGAVIDPPSGGAGEDEDDEEAGDDEAADSEEDGSDLDACDDENEELAAAPHGAPVPRGAGPARGSGWSKVDAIVFFLALGVLALSLWAIRFLAQRSPA